MRNGERFDIIATWPCLEEPWCGLLPDPSHLSHRSRLFIAANATCSFFHPLRWQKIQFCAPLPPYTTSCHTLSSFINAVKTSQDPNNSGARNRCTSWWYIKVLEPTRTHNTTLLQLAITHIYLYLFFDTDMEEIVSWIRE